MPFIRFGSAYCGLIAFILLAMLLTWVKAVAEAIACVDFTSALDCSLGEVVEACTLRGLSISPICYCDLRIVRYCSDACDVGSETQLCSSYCQAYLKRMQENCSPSDSASGMPAGLVVAVVIGSVFGILFLTIISMALMYMFRAVTNREPRSIRGYLRFLLHLGCVEASSHPVEPVNDFPARPTDAIFVGDNCSSATVLPRTVLSHDFSDSHEHQERSDLLLRPVG